MYIEDHAFVLHYRPYKETSLLVTLLTAKHGKINAIAKGAKKAKSNNFTYQFTLTKITFYGKHELVTLVSMEAIQYFDLQHNMIAGIYLNELLYKLLGSHDPALEVFLNYQTVLQQIIQHNTKSTTHKLALQKAIRLFEKNLLHFMGYAINFTFDATNGATVQLNKIYYYLRNHGLLETSTMRPGCITGTSCLEYYTNLSSEYFNNNAASILAELKYFMRYVLNSFTNNTLQSFKIQHMVITS